MKGEGIAIMKEKKPLSRDLVWKKIAFGVLFSAIISFLLTLLMAMLVNKERIATEVSLAMIFGIHIISAFLGVQILGLLWKITVVEALVVPCLYISIYASISIAMFDGITVSCFFNLIASVIAAAASYYLHYSMQKKTKKRKIRKRNW